MVKLKDLLKEDLSGIKPDLSNEEFGSILDKVKAIPKDSKDKQKIETIIENELDLKSIKLSEPTIEMLLSDNSDLDNLLDQIDHELKKRKNI